MYQNLQDSHKVVFKKKGIVRRTHPEQKEDSKSHLAAKFRLPAGS